MVFKNIILISVFKLSIYNHMSFTSYIWRHYSEEDFTKLPKEPMPHNGKNSWSRELGEKRRESYFLTGTKFRKMKKFCGRMVVTVA